MIHSIITVYDEKAHAHLPPFFTINTELAKRAFTDAINSPDHRFSKHPSDYTLFVHGSWEDEDGAFLLQSAPKPLGNGVEFIQIPNNEQVPYSDYAQIERKNETKVSNVSQVRHDTKG